MGAVPFDSLLSEPDLRAVVQAWSTLSEITKAEILATIKLALPHQ